MNFKRISGGMIFCVLALCGGVVASAAPAKEALAEAIAKGRMTLQTEVADKVPGYSVSVLVDGKIVWSEGFGYADLANKAPVTTNTRFRIGSISKSLTAAGLALLVEKGKLDMDAPIQKYIPDYPKKDDVITLRMLAGHLSGIRHYRGTEATSNKPYPNLRSALKIFEDDPLESKPGTKFGYSSYNWDVIGVAMEAAAKKDFLAYMDAAVIKPLKLTNTRPDRAGVADPQRTQFYETDAAGKFFIGPTVDLSYMWPGGGYLSTADDLVRFGSAMMEPGFLKPESHKLLFTSQKLPDGKLTHNAVGWFLGKTTIYHGGDSVGGTAMLVMDPAAHTVVAILCNRGHIKLSTVPLQQPVPRTDLKLPGAALAIVKAFAPLSTKAEPAK